MLYDLPYPIAGDVLFYTSGKPHGKAIKAKQESLNFKRPELMHAALMVDSRVLTEATTKNGVGYLSLFASRKTYQKYRPAAILRHRALAERREISADLWQHSFYFFHQRYDWVGAFQRHKANETKKICSTLVQMILSRLEYFDEVVATHGNFQIFPAELFGVLRRMGFEEVEPYREPEADAFGDGDDLMMLKMLEQNREIEALGADAEHWAFVGNGIGELELFRLETAGSTERMVWVLSYAVPYNGSPIIRLIEQLKDLDDNISTYIERRDSPLMNWRDKEAAKLNLSKLEEKIEYQYDLLHRQITALHDHIQNVVPAFLQETGWGASCSLALFEPVFQLRFLDAGSELEHTPKKIKDLVELSMSLDARYRMCAPTSTDTSIREATSQFFSALYPLINVMRQSIKDQPNELSLALLEANKLVTRMIDITEKNMVASGIDVEAMKMRNGSDTTPPGHA